MTKSRHKYNKDPYYGTGVKRIFRPLTEADVEKYPAVLQEIDESDEDWYKRFHPVGCPPCPHWHQLWGLICVQMQEEQAILDKKEEYRKKFDYAKQAKEKRRAKKLGKSTNIPLRKK